MWAVAAAAGAWLVAAVTGFITRPPLWLEADHQQAFGLATFGASAVAGVLAVPMTTWGARRHKWAWWLFGVISLVAALATLALYEARRTAWGVEYGDALLVKGATYRPAAAAYRDTIARRDGQPPSDAQLLLDNAGRVDEIWDEEELSSRRLTMGALYSTTVALFAAAMLGIAHAAVSARDRRAPRRTTIKASPKVARRARKASGGNNAANTGSSTEQLTSDRQPRE